MKQTQELHDIGQSIWPDHTDRGLLAAVRPVAPSSGWRPRPAGLGVQPVLLNGRRRAVARRRSRA